MSQTKSTKNSLVVVSAGLIAGSVDLLLAFVKAWWSWSLSPERVLRFVASGLIGDRAFQGPTSIALLGLAIHFLIAFFWTIIFFLVYPRLRLLIPWKFLQGLFYGTFIWVMMNLVVLPLTQAPTGELHWAAAIKEMGVLIVAIGLPLAYIAGKYYRNRAPK